MPSFKFFDLPREIRDRVIAFVYPADEVSVWTPRFFPGSPHRFLMREHVGSSFSIPNEDLAPLLVNHQFSAEAMAEFYGSHIFVAEPKNLIPFLRGIGDRRNLIRRVEIQDLFDEMQQTKLIQQVLTILSTLPALQLVKITYIYSSQFDLGLARIDDYAINFLDERVAVKVFCKNRYIMDVHVSGTDSEHVYEDTRIWTRVTGPEGWKEE